MARHRVREGDDWWTIAGQYNLSVVDVLEYNPGVTTLTAGSYINLPDALPEEEPEPQAGYARGIPDTEPQPEPRAGYARGVPDLGERFEEERTPQPPRSESIGAGTPEYPADPYTELMGGGELTDYTRPEPISVRPYEGTYPGAFEETAAPTEEGIYYPEGWNPAEFNWSLQHMPMSFISDFYSGYYTEQGGRDLGPTEIYTGGGGGVPTEELPAFKGLPSYHAWEMDEETGQWERKEHESVFDALYEYNGIDPEDPAQVQFFWEHADEDLLHMGEVFDVIEYESGGAAGFGTGGGYGFGTPSRMVGRGRRPTRGEYATYLGLVNWRI